MLPQIKLKQINRNLNPNQENKDEANLGYLIQVFICATDELRSISWKYKFLAFSYYCFFISSIQTCTRYIIKPDLH